MASFKEFFDFGRNTNANVKRGGLYAIQPEKPVGEPPLKVGHSRNLISRMGSYRNQYPQGIRVHMIGRVAGRDQDFPSVSRDDVVAAEKKMVKSLSDTLTETYMNRKEWFSADKLDKVKKALADAHNHYAISLGMQARLYTGDDIKRLAKGPMKRVAPEVVKNEEKKTLVKMEPPSKKRRVGLSGAELMQGAQGAKRKVVKEEEQANKKQKTEPKSKVKQEKTDDNQLKLDVFRERKHRSGQYYKVKEEPPPPEEPEKKRRRIRGKTNVGEKVVPEEPISRMTKKTKN